MERPKLNPKDIQMVLDGIQNRVDYETSADRKSDGAFVSTHEILGALEEEHTELIDAVRSNNREHVIDELYDSAVVCVWGILSLIQQENEKYGNGRQST